jgi:hypothetical protein
MKYIAKVKQVLVPGLHTWARRDSAGQLQQSVMPSPDYVIIETGEQKSAGCMIYRFIDDGTCVGDTWHENLVAAKHQAHYEYGLTDNDWSIQTDA